MVLHASSDTHAQELTTIADLECYLSKPAHYPSQPAKLLLLLTSGTGIHSTANQLQADAFASHGYLVAMPDQFASDPAPQTHVSTSQTPSQAPSIIESVKLGLADAAKSFRIDMWLARHTPTTVLPRLHAFVDALGSEFADCVSYGDGVYGAGYCFGGRYIMLLSSAVSDDVASGQRKVEAQKDAEEGMVRRGPRVKAGVVAHGTMVGREEFETLAAPTGIVAVKADPLFPDEVRDEGVRQAKSRDVEVEVWVHDDVPHGMYRLPFVDDDVRIKDHDGLTEYTIGFAVVGEYEDQKVREAQKSAFEQMLGFLDAH